MDPLVAFGLALAAGPLFRRHAAMAAAVALAAVALGPRRRRGVLAAVVLAGLSWGVWASARAEARFARALAVADAALPGVHRCAATATVAGSPSDRGGATRWVADLDPASCEGGARAPPLRAALYGGALPPLARGDRVEIVAELAPPQMLANFELGNPVPAAARRGVVRSGSALDVRRLSASAGPAGWIDRARARVRERIGATFAADVAPMARALVLGEDDLSQEDGDAFRTSGLAHLLAVSGMHLVIVVMGLVALLRGALARVPSIAERVEVGRLASAFGAAACWIYADFAGASGSAIRAAAMLSLTLVVRAGGHRADPTRAFGASIAGLAIADPLIGVDVSFVLSVAATGGLLAFSRPLAAAAASRWPRAPGWLVRSAATTAAATAPCAPVLATFAPTLPLAGVVANLIAVPVGELAALPLCLAHAFLALVAPGGAAERGCAIVASGALVAVRGLARAFASLPASNVAVPPPTPGQLVVLSITALASSRLAEWRARRGAVFAAAAAGAAGVAVLEGMARLAGAPRDRLRVTFLDVGQGDAAIVDLPSGGAMIVDGGGVVGSTFDVGARVLAPALAARRRTAAGPVVLSHPHPDHYGGLVTGLARVRIDEVWDTGQGAAEGAGGAYAALLARARGSGAGVRGPDVLCGSHEIGGARVEVLAPCPSYAADRGPNDNSFVVRLSYGSRAVLFAGDAERAEEADLLRAGSGRLRADVLKVGHHGSKTSSSEAFVAAVAPVHAIVSVGARNRFGHPAETTLATLARAGATVWRTDRDGAVTVETDGLSLEVASAKGGR